MADIYGSIATIAEDEASDPYADIAAPETAATPASATPPQPMEYEAYEAELIRRVRGGQKAPEIRAWAESVGFMPGDGLEETVAQIGQGYDGPIDARKGVGDQTLSLGEIGSFARGAADAGTFNFADELAAGVRALPALADGGEAFDQAYRQNWLANDTQREVDKVANAGSRIAGQGAGTLATAALPIGFAARGANWLGTGARAAGSGALIGGVSATGEGSPNNRTGGTGAGMALGATGGLLLAPIASASGAIIRAGAEKLPQVNAGVNALARRAGFDPSQLRERAQNFLANDVRPTLTDVVDESGRGVIRSAASRMTPGRQVAQDFAESRALNLPDRMGQQARRVMSDDPRTPAQIADALKKSRSEKANVAFGAVRSEPVNLTAEAIDALGTTRGRDAIRAAMSVETDPVIRRQLGRLPNVLAQTAQMSPAVRAQVLAQDGLTVGMADIISRFLLDQGRRAAPTEGRALLTFGNAIRDAAKDSSEGYRRALTEFGEDSALLNVAERGEDFLKRNTDEFASDLAGATDEELALARATGRRAIERAAGESVASAPAVARRIATAPEQRARNEALLGADDATRLEGGMAAEERAVRNAYDIAPRSGSQTALRSADSDTVDAAFLGLDAMSGGKAGIIRSAVDWLKAKGGMPDAAAEDLVMIATDPARLDEAIAILEQRLGNRQAAEITINSIRGALSRAAGAASAESN